MFVITGASGHTGKEISRALLAAGKEVVVVGRSEGNLQELISLGAKPAIGQLEDSDFLTKTLQGAEAAYLMIPPNWNPQPNWRKAQRVVSEAITTAVKNSGLKKAVLLSSQGAHMAEGAGPVSGIHELEELLKSVAGLDLKILRPGYFMENLFANIGMIKNLGFQGSTLDGDVKIPIVHTRDIAEVAIKNLLDLDFKGNTIDYVNGSRDLTFNEITEVIGKAISNTDLKYVTFSKEDAKAGMMAAGLVETIADGYIEMQEGINSGKYLEGYVRTEKDTTPTSIEWFVENQLAPAILSN